MQNSPEKMFPVGPLSGPTIKIQDSRTLSHAHTGCTVKCGNAYDLALRQ